MSALNDYFSLKGRVAVVTGAGGHLCSAFSKALCVAGAKVVLVDLRSEKSQKAASELQALGYSAESFSMDATLEDDWQRLAKFLEKKFGKVDILINGAGTNSASDFLEVKLEDFNNVIKSQLISTVLGCQAIGRLMCDAKSGCIINVSSASADPPLSKAYAYSAAKSGIVSVTKNLAREWAPLNVRVNAIRPGFFPTEWNRKNFITPEREFKILSHTPMGRYGDPSELEGAIIWLCSSSASFVTGAEIAVDGGFSCMTI